MRIRGRAIEYFGNFATIDAGWQILLLLFTNPLIEEDELLSDLRICLRLSEATLKRCLRYAEYEGFITKTPIGGTHISLTDKARTRVEEVFTDA
jgi:DNA-binding MarR family transcriptional regulator